MKRSRREFVKSVAGATVLARGSYAAARAPEGPSMNTTRTYDIAVVGAGDPIRRDRED